MTVITGLEHPWGMTWLPDGSMLITERPGRLRMVRKGKLDPNPILGVPEVFAVGQGDYSMYQFIRILLPIASSISLTPTATTPLIVPVSRVRYSMAKAYGMLQ